MEFSDLPWKEHGYKITERSGSTKWDRMFQKRVLMDTTSRKTKYFITFEYFDYKMPNRESRGGMYLSVVLYRQVENLPESFTINMSFYRPTKVNINAIEVFIESQYRFNNCIPDLHNND